MRVMVDTCVIMDGLEKREPFWIEARDIFHMAAARRADFFLSAKSVTDIFYMEHRRTHDAALTRDVISRLLKLFFAADTTAADCRNALLTETADYEDAVMMETAFREKMDCIVTRNTIDYKKSRVPIYTPRELLALMSDKRL